MMAVGESAAVTLDTSDLRARIAELEAQIATHQEAQIVTRQEAREAEQDECLLTWRHIEDEAFRRATENLPMLAEERAMAVGQGERPHLLIEGDNYHALLELSYTHHDKIDVIYIDPPYNINVGSLYADSYPHSEWVSQRQLRLTLAWKLLKPKGVLFISIDDAEHPRLRLLCDQLFGAGHFLGTLTWINKTKSVNTRASKRKLQRNAEYVLAYSKGSAQHDFELRPKGVDREYPHEGRLGACRREGIETSALGRYDRSTMKFPIAGIGPRAGKRWKIGQEEARRLEDAGKIEVINGIPMRAYYPEDDSPIEYPFWSHLTDVGTAETGKAELTSIVGEEHGFDTVKPRGLLEELLSHFPDNITVLDYYAGSGTTGHAVLAMNRRDGGRRRFILVTDNEGGICRELCHKRLRRVMEGYMASDTGIHVEGLGGALRFFVAEGNAVLREEMVPSDRSALRVAELATDTLRLETDCYRPLPADTDGGTPEFALFESDAAVLAVLHRYGAREALAARLAEVAAGRPIHIYPSLPGGTPSEDWFKTRLGDRVSVNKLPDPILRNWRSRIDGARER